MQVFTNIRIFGALCVMLAVLAFSACGGAHSSPEEAAKQMTQFMVDGKIESMIKELRNSSGEAFSKDDEKELLNAKFQMGVENIAQKGKVKSISTSEVSYNDDKTKASVTVVIEFESGESSTNTWQVWLFNGQWFCILS